MKWRDRKQSTNVDDRRGRSGGGGGRGLPSIGTLMFLWPLVKPLLRSKLGIAVVGIGAAAYFIGPSLLGMGGASSSKDVDPNSEDVAFIKTVHGDIETVWAKIFAEAGQRYPVPELVLYTGSTTSGCGPASSRMGPFYCPADTKIYVDMGFFEDLEHKHGAGGDFARAYVLAHEVGHHIQNLEGTLDKVETAKHRVTGNDKNQLQVRVELQADCYAGVWAHHVQKQFKALEPGDLEEALTAAASIGDDRLQKQAQGFAIPHTFTHGSSKQRAEWFARGVKNGRVQDCQTFGS
ncbi:neutral zinc metallopeptidase [uncultured Cocleimonas sp.]|uniref:KPN_02809 family neutral zinc metallopeptidase n=1 Tax=uncultured Cocleimonas sp. TaxID=1051587 RepID=UPI00260D3D74|nr:neutral zinc metallopeptidase [uncultured Cocleimonas sp.]